MNNKVLVIRAENCTGCRMCELACSSTKFGLFIPSKSRIKVITNGLEGWSRPVVCVQCPEASCMHVCPTDAIYENKTSKGEPIIDINPDLCISCQKCIDACPFGAIYFFKDIKVIKCDLCDGSPKCVEFCSYKCLDFYEIPEEQYNIRSKNIKALVIDIVDISNNLSPLERRVKFSLELTNILPISNEKKKN